MINTNDFDLMSNTNNPSSENNNSIYDAVTLPSWAYEGYLVNKPLFNMSLQNYKLNNFLNLPSPSTRSCVDDVSKTNKSSLIFKLTLAINLNLIDFMQNKGKEPFWDVVTPDIEDLSKLDLEFLLLELSDNILESDTINNLCYNIHNFLHFQSIGASLKKAFLDEKKFTVSFDDASVILNDLNLDPMNEKILLTKIRLIHPISLNRSIIEISKNDLHTIIEFYSSNAELLYKKILLHLHCIRRENLMNDSFTMIQNRLLAEEKFVHDSPNKKRTFEQATNIRAERIPKMIRGHHAI